MADHYCQRCNNASWDCICPPVGAVVVDRWHEVEQTQKIMRDQMVDKLRCRSVSPGGLRCGQDHGHPGDHSALIPSSAKWQQFSR